MGYSGADFPVLVTEIISRHAPDLDTNSLRVKLSRGGRYQSLTFNVHASSREQLDAIYRDLTGHRQVLLAL
jgi:putative lipoic acid-binding regulatory protein